MLSDSLCVKGCMHVISAMGGTAGKFAFVCTLPVCVGRWGDLCNQKPGAELELGLLQGRSQWLTKKWNYSESDGSNQSVDDILHKEAKKKKKREGVKTSNRISIVSHIQICQTPTWSKAHDAGFKRFQFISEFNSFSKILIILSLTHKMLKYREEKTRLTISVCIRVHVRMCICTRPYLDVGTEFC